jgi:hypothetical protein
MNIKEKFHCETLNTWASLKYTEPKNIKEVYAQPLWQNELLTIEGKMIKYNVWNRAGINNIVHIIDNNGRIASLNFIENKYNIRPKQLEYNSLIHCIPKLWKTMIKNTTEHLGYKLPNDYSIKIDDKLTNIEEIATRELYCHISNNYKIKPATSKNRWIELYNEMNFENEYWELIYETPFKLTKNSKVQMTQYKIIHRILAVNHNLIFFFKIENETCDYCNEVDTIEHFLYQCPKTMKLWESIQTWWKTNFQFKIDISVLEIIFGLPNENNEKTINLYNYIILYAKY